MLSFLPTKYAMRCSVLSTSWKNIWDSVPNLDFENKDKSDSVGFMNFVDHVLNFPSSIDIQKFRLHCFCVGDYNRIDGWIRTAIRRKAVELDLGVSNTGKTLELPKSVFMCKTLVVLKVKSNVITYNPPTSGCFPSLKFLHITAEGPDSDSMENLFSCCPVLEDLIIDITCGVRGCNIKICAAELKRLIITFHRSLIPLDREKICINAPKLGSLDVKEDILAKYCFENAKSLVKANVDLYYHRQHRYVEFVFNATALLAGISNVKYLSLSAHVLRDHCLPAFDNLSELKLVLYDCYHWDLLMNLLNKSPILEYLVLVHKEDKKCVLHYSFGEYSDFKHNLPSELRWHTPEYVPACLISHLKTYQHKRIQGMLA